MIRFILGQRSNLRPKHRSVTRTASSPNRVLERSIPGRGTWLRPAFCVTLIATDQSSPNPAVFLWEFGGFFFLHVQFYLFYRANNSMFFILGCCYSWKCDSCEHFKYWRTEGYNFKRFWEKAHCRNKYEWWELKVSFNPFNHYWKYKSPDSIICKRQGTTGWSSELDSNLVESNDNVLNYNNKHKKIVSPFISVMATSCTSLNFPFCRK